MSGSQGRGKISKWLLDIGRWIGQAKRKEPDLVSMWLQLCESMGKKPSERVLEFIAWDLENQGVDLKSVREIEMDKEMQKAFSQVTLAQQISELAQQFASQMLQREWQHTQEVQQLLEMLRMKTLQEITLPEAYSKQQKPQSEEEEKKWKWEKRT